MLFSVTGWVSWSLPSRPTASQAESGLSFFSHFRSSSLIGRIISSSFPSALVSRSTVVSFVLSWIQVDLGRLGIFVNFFIDSFAVEFAVFSWSFH